MTPEKNCETILSKHSVKKVVKKQSFIEILKMNSEKAEKGEKMKKNTFKKTSDWKDFFDLIRKTKPNVTLISFAVLLSAVSAVVPTLIPGNLKNIIDSYMVIGTLNTTGLALLLGIFICSAGIGALGSYMLGVAGHNVVAGLREMLWKKIVYLPIKFYDQNRSADIASRVVNDTTVIYNLISNALSQFVNSVLMIIFCGFWMFYYDWQLTLVMLVSIPVFLMFFIPLGKTLSRLSKNMQNSTAKLNIKAVEVASHIKLIKSFTAEQDQIKKGVKNIKNLRNIGINQTKWMVIVNPVINLTMMIIIVTIIGYGGLKLANGTLTPGTFIAFLILIFYIIGPMTNFGLFFTQLHKTLGATERIIQILSEEEETQDKGKLFNITDRDILMKDVSFYYSGHVQKEFSLKNINLRIEGGKTYALVGPSGSGKTTLISLLVRYYKPDRGSIYIGDENIEEFSLSSWRDQIGYVSQEHSIISGTVRENLIFGLKEIPGEEKIIEACKMAYAWDFIKNLPDGLDTDIGERGLKLSGGQKQRIAIARMFLKDPKIIILDEATANLDSHSEKVINEAMKEITKGRTAIVIAHRLSTIINADHIIFMENGRITGQGNHWELKRTHKLYKKFCEYQFREQPDQQWLGNTV